MKVIQTGKSEKWRGKYYGI